MATLTVQDVEQGGTTFTTATPGGSGDDFVAADDGRHAALVYNGSSGAVVATMAKQLSNSFQDGVGVTSLADITHNIAAGGVAVIPVTRGYIRANDGKVEVSIDDPTSVEIAAVRLKRID